MFSRNATAARGRLSTPSFAGGGGVGELRARDIWKSKVPKKKKKQLGLDSHARMYDEDEYN